MCELALMLLCDLACVSIAMEVHTVLVPCMALGVLIAQHCATRGEC